MAHRSILRTRSQRSAVLTPSSSLRMLAIHDFEPLVDHAPSLYEPSAIFCSSRPHPALVPPFLPGHSPCASGAAAAPVRPIDPPLSFPGPRDSAAHASTPLEPYDQQLPLSKGWLSASPFARTSWQEEGRGDDLLVSMKKGVGNLEERKDLLVHMTTRSPEKAGCSAAKEVASGLQGGGTEETLSGGMECLAVRKQRLRLWGPGWAEK
ncbi:hypothetical protein C8R44DRAFT_737140 [Mycena epipterygia]|nr:hypothetical protein C8R44DRAFT_737140 [Mycena epipterygia]